MQAGELNPNGSGRLRIVRGIELGHIFKLGTKYADALGRRSWMRRGKNRPVIMGSYGIGIERIIACHIEQNHDDERHHLGQGACSLRRSPHGGQRTERGSGRDRRALYGELQSAGLDVLFDDRKEISPGFKFKDADLLGMPYQVIVGEKNLAAGNIEIKERKTWNADSRDEGQLASKL